MTARAVMLGHLMGGGVLTSIEAERLTGAGREACRQELKSLYDRDLIQRRRRYTMQSGTPPFEYFIDDAAAKPARCHHCGGEL